MLVEGISSGTIVMVATSRRNSGFASTATNNTGMAAQQQASINWQGVRSLRYTSTEWLVSRFYQFFW